MENWQLVTYLRFIGERQRAVADSASLKIHVPVTAETVLESLHLGDEWLTYSGSYNSHRYSVLDEIDRENAFELQLRWIYYLGEDALETVPLVTNGTMFVTKSDPNAVVA